MEEYRCTNEHQHSIMGIDPIGGARVKKDYAKLETEALDLVIDIGFEALKLVQEAVERDGSPEGDETPILWRTSAAGSVYNNFSKTLLEACQRGRERSRDTATDNLPEYFEITDDRIIDLHEQRKLILEKEGVKKDAVEAESVLG